MRFSTSVAVSAAALSGLAAAVAPANTISMPMARNAQKHSRAVLHHKRQALAKRAGTLPVTLTSDPYEGGGFYFVNVSVGTPPQQLQLDIDTGSSDVWFFGQRACEESDVSCEGRYFIPSRSTSLTPISDGFEIAYGDGSQVEGEYIADNFQIGGTTIRNLTMAIAEASEGVDIGIMGIGYDTDESIVASGAAEGLNIRPYANLVDVMKTQGLISTRSYSLYLDDLQASTGAVLFGGYDPDKFEGELGILPVQQVDGGFTRFTVIWDSLGVTTGGSSMKLQSNSVPTLALLDSGTSITLLPEDLYDQLAGYFGVLDSRTYGQIVNCSMNGKTGSLNYQMGGPNGVVISVPFEELALPLIDSNGNPLVENGQEVCAFGMEPNPAGELTIFGDTFLRSAYVVYDLDANQIGLAQARFNSTASNVQVISAGPSQTLSGSYITPMTTITPSADAGTAGQLPSGDPLLSFLTQVGFSFTDDPSQTAAATSYTGLVGTPTTYSNRVTIAAETQSGAGRAFSTDALPATGGNAVGNSPASTSTGAAAAVMVPRLASTSNVFGIVTGTLGMIAIGFGLVL